MVAGQSPRVQAYPATHVEAPATATGPVSGNGVRSARHVTPPSRLKNRPGPYAHPCCADTNAMPPCAPGWRRPMADRLAAQCLPPSVVRSIHDRTVVLSPAYPAIAAMPVSRSGNAIARAWYLPCSSLGIRGGLVGLDGVVVTCAALLLAHPASTTAATIAPDSVIAGPLIWRLREQMTHSFLRRPQVRRGCYRTENQPTGVATSTGAPNRS